MPKNLARDSRPQTRKWWFLGTWREKTSKNNLTNFGFWDFYTIYKRGNENWEKSW